MLQPARTWARLAPHGYPLAYASARRKRNKEGAAMRKLFLILLVAAALGLFWASDAL